MTKKLKIKTKLLPIILPSTIFFILFFTKFTVWDNPNNRWLIEDIYYKPDANYKATVAPKISLNQNITTKTATLNDASKLNQVFINDFVQIENKKNIFDAIEKAKTQKKSISISGARHSMGGQNLGQSIHLDMLKYDKVIEFANENVTVESGITWKQLQEFLGPKNKAIAVMQDSNIFTVGGSMGSNVHGKDIRFGQLISTVNWFKMIDSSGQEILIMPENNLFGLVIGGFGGFGIITEVNLKVVPNTNYKYTITHQPADTLVSRWAEYKKLGAEQIEGHFSVSKDVLLEDLQIYYFEPTDTKSKDDVSGENSIWLRKLVYRLSRESDLGKRFRWWMQKNVSPLVDPGFSSRNGSMAAPFRVLEIEDANTTDILQEYFVPTNKVDKFVQDYRQMLIKHNINLINCGLRKVQPDTNALVNYSEQEMFGFVCYYNVSRDKTKNANLTNFTGEMLDYLNQIEGKFYLAYATEGFENKILQMYPKLTQLLVEKQKYDPNNIFYNKFFEKLQNKSK